MAAPVNAKLSAPPRFKIDKPRRPSERKHVDDFKRPARARARGQSLTLASLHSPWSKLGFHKDAWPPCSQTTRPAAKDSRAVCPQGSSEATGGRHRSWSVRCSNAGIRCSNLGPKSISWSRAGVQENEDPGLSPTVASPSCGFF